MKYLRFLKQGLWLGLLGTISIAEPVLIQDSCVSRSQEYLHTVSQSELLERSYDDVVAYSSMDYDFLSFNKVYYNPSREDSVRVTESEIFRDFCPNNFLKGLFLAFSDHRNVELSPDMIWLLICQGVSNHLNQHTDFAATLNMTDLDRNRIEIRNDTIVMEQNDPAWQDILNQFTDTLSSFVDSTHISLLTPTFSTTTSVHTTAYQITLMNSVQSFNDYYVTTLCGIPEIRITGTVDDWQWIYDNVDQFSSYGLEEWIETIKPHLEQFVLSFSLEPDLEFWRSIFREKSGSGTPLRVTGWVKDFFPYTLNNRDEFEPNPYLGILDASREDLLITGEDGRDYYDAEEYHNWKTRGLRISQFPNGVVKTPFTWKYYRRNYRMYLSAGFVGASYDIETDYIIPRIGWIVYER